MWDVSFTHPLLTSVLSGELLLHIPCLITFSFLFIWGVSLTDLVLVSWLCDEFLTHIPSSGEFLLRIQCWFNFYVGSFSYTSRAGFICMWGVSLTHPEFWGVSLTHPMLVSLLSGEFLLHIPCWFHFMWGVSLTHPVLASFLSWEFLLHIPCWLYFYLGFHFYVGSFSYTSRAGFILIWGVYRTHPVLD